MRNSLHLLSRPLGDTTNTKPSSSVQPTASSIRLVTASPSATGPFYEASSSFSNPLSFDNLSWGSVPSSVLAPKPDSTSTPKRKLVPKKSKLGLLNVVANKDKENRRVDENSRPLRAGNHKPNPSIDDSVEIYVDSTIDPDIGEIIMVKKKKSRAALNDMGWGPLSNVTNVPASTKTIEDNKALKTKGEEKGGWWTIGRGRKDSKDKSKEGKENSRGKSPESSALPIRSKTPELFKSSNDARARFNSLDSGTLLKSSASAVPPHVRVSESEATYSRSGTLAAGGFLASSSTAGAAPIANNQGSIAVRAMRSVRSLARIGSWAQLRKDSGNYNEKEKERKKDGEKKEKKSKKDKSEKSKEKKSKKEKKEKEREKEKEAEEDIPPRKSTSSVEVDAISPNPLSTHGKEGGQTLRKKKGSILGLGLPSSIRLPSLRSGSAGSLQTQLNRIQNRTHESIPDGAEHRVPSENSGIIDSRRGRSSSVMSTLSSLRPVSTFSNYSRNSMISGTSQNSQSNGSGCSVRWDEEGLETVREVRRKEREEKAKDEKKKSKKDKKKKKADKEKEKDTRLLESRKRTAITDIFPDVAGSRRFSASHEIGSRSSSIQGHVLPLLTVEEATNDGHGIPTNNYNTLHEPPHIGMASKKVRPRPVSEGRNRPLPMYQDDEDNAGVLSILDAATNDLAQLIMTLNLEATPNTTPNPTPLRPLENESLTEKSYIMPESPLSKTLKKGMASISSLRSHAQSLRKSGSQLLLGSPKNTLKKKRSKSGPEVLIGQQIAPWSKLMEGLSPKRSMTFSSPANKDHLNVSPAGTFRKGHRRQTTPAPEPEPALVFQPLCPAARPRTGGTPASVPSPGNESNDSSIEVGRGGVVARSKIPTIKASPSAMTFGTPSPASSGKRKVKANKFPIPPETRRVLGMSGTLGGGSDLPAMYAVPEMDTSDPDSDIPDELQFILKATNSDGGASNGIQVPLDDDENDTFSFPVPKRAGSTSYGPSGSPPTGPLPIPSRKASSATIFRTRVEDENHTGTLSVGERENSSEFDFTGELRRLSESVESDRRSFVEQLETAFMTPAKVELDFNLLGKGFLNATTVSSPIKKLPFAFPVDVEDSDHYKTVNMPSHSTSGFDSRNEMVKTSKLVDDEPTTMTITAEAISRIKSIVNLGRSGSQLEPSILPSEGDSSKLKKSISISSSNRSNGELNMSFKFGGRPNLQASPVKSEDDKPLTLSDIIPPLSHVRSLSEPSIVLEDEEDSVLKSIYAKAQTAGGISQPRPRLNSNASSKRKSRMTARSFLAQSRPTSLLSFTGLDSFEEIRRNFEFCGPRPTFYPPATNSGGTSNYQRDSVLSIASVSSYGRVTNAGLKDPFGFLSQLQERPLSEDMTSTTLSYTVDDTFSFLHHPSRRIRVDSDASSFYFRPPLPSRNTYSWGTDRRRDSAMSYASANGGPPISFYNRNFAAHRLSDLSASVSSSYAMHGASGGRAWTRHRQDQSIDSIMGDIPARRMSRPGVGDKMFDLLDHGVQLSSVALSPQEPEQSSLLPQYTKSSSYEDSILDASEEPKLSEDSLFGNQRLVGMESLFSANDSGIGSGFMPQYRPVSIISIPGVYNALPEDDTWISMIGGGHVRRNSVASDIQTSPCARVEKRRNARFQPFGNVERKQVSPNTMSKVVETKSSIVSTSSHFGREEMIQASQSLLERKSQEESCLIAAGEDSSLSFRSGPVFSRPAPAGRSRSSTCTSSSGGDTPPLSSDGSSISGGSQSSIDLSQLDSLLANATFPASNPGISARNRTRPRARGQGHRRRYSAARTSRATSVYETIEEEPFSDSPGHTVTSIRHASPTTTMDPIMIVDADTGSIDMTALDTSFWSSERDAVALNKYYALRHEAEGAVDESKRLWVDTPFSIFAVQNFDPPRNPEGMKALLQNSIQNYGPLPSELRSRRRSRTCSRPSPYPLARPSRVFYPPEHTRVSPSDQPAANASMSKMPSMVLQEVNVNSNVAPSPAPSFKFKAPENSPAVKRTVPFGQPLIRPRVASTTRRAALGWAKGNVKPSNGDQKENKENVSYGTIKPPAESLRLNRPRPRGRVPPATHAAQPRPIRV